jgi:hypothetical protein
MCQQGTGMSLRSPLPGERVGGSDVKGIILNLVEEAVVAEHGEGMWDRLLDRAGVDGAYTSLGNYPDDELVRLVAAGADLLGVTPVELTLHLGNRALGGLARRYPQYFEPHANTREFLLTLNDVIHPEVRKLHPDSSPPDFWFDDSDDGLLVHYRSERHLCRLAEGMMQGAGTHYGEVVSISHRSCMDEGDEHCTMSATFEPVG